MENNTNLEIILFANHHPANLCRRSILKWLATTVQSAIEKQDEQTEKLSLNILKQTPPIYMS